MCGRVRLSSDYSEIKIKLKFDLDAPAPNFTADWNKPPTEPMLVAIRSESGKRTPKMMRWGLLPAWAKQKRRLSDEPARSSDENAGDSATNRLVKSQFQSEFRFD
jgi:putative SOS response-associated peptidase YedK